MAGTAVAGHAAGDALAEAEDGLRVGLAWRGRGSRPRTRAWRRPSAVEAHDGGVVGADQPPRLLGGLDEERAQVAQGRRLQAEVVEGGQLRGQALGAGQPRAISGGRRPAGRRAPRAGSAPRRQRRAPRGEALEHAQGSARRAHGHGQLEAQAPRAACSGVRARTAQRSSSASAAARLAPAARPGLRLQAQLLAVRGVEGDAVVAEVRVDARRPASSSSATAPALPRHGARSARPRARAARRAGAAGRRSGGCAGTTPRGRRRWLRSWTSASVKPPGLLSGHDQAEHLALRDHGHQHDRVRVQRARPSPGISRGSVRARLLT